jgi:hypothetical protein
MTSTKTDSNRFIFYFLLTTYILPAFTRKPGISVATTGTLTLLFYTLGFPELSTKLQPSYLEILKGAVKKHQKPKKFNQNLSNFVDLTLSSFLYHFSTKKNFMLSTEFLKLLFRLFVNENVRKSDFFTTKTKRFEIQNFKINF